MLSFLLAAQRENLSPGVGMLMGLGSFSVFFVVLLIRGRIFRWLYRVTDLPLFNPDPVGEKRVDAYGIAGAVGLLGCFMSALFLVFAVRDAL